MKRFGIGLAGLAAGMALAWFVSVLAQPAPGQFPSTQPPTLGVVVGGCGTPPFTYQIGKLAPATVDQNGKWCVNQ